MTAPHQSAAASDHIDPAWLERQLARFKPSDLDGVVRLMRSYDRDDMRRARGEDAA